MKKVYIIGKIENDQPKYLFRVHRAAYWTDDINQAAQFENEKKAEDFLMEEVREPKKAFFQIVWYYVKA